MGRPRQLLPRGQHHPGQIPPSRRCRVPVAHRSADRRAAVQSRRAGCRRLTWVKAAPLFRVADAASARVSHLRRRMPMIKTILVAATGNQSDAATFAAALAIARPCAAHLDVLHVRLDAIGVAVAMTTTDVGGGALTAGLIEQLEQDAREREAKAREIFTRFCGGAGLVVTTAPFRESRSALGRMACRNRRGGALDGDLRRRVRPDRGAARDR